MLTEKSHRLKYKKGRTTGNKRPKKMLAVIFTLGDLVANSTAYIGSVFTDLTGLIALVIGLPLAFWAIRKVVSLVRAR